MSEAIAALARRLRGDPFFLASALEEYARSEQLTWGALSDVLRCPEETLAPLALCRRPRSDDASFWDDTTRIAERFEVSAGTLGDILRRADALDAWRGGTEDAAWLQAARDRDTGRPEEEPP